MKYLIHQLITLALAFMLLTVGQAMTSPVPAAAEFPQAYAGRLLDALFDIESEARGLRRATEEQNRILTRQCEATYIVAGRGDAMRRCRE